MQIINPATEETKEIEETSIEEIPKMIEKAKEAQKIWEETTLEERIEWMEKLAKLIEKRKDEIASKITDDMGKPINSSLRETEAVANRIRFFNDNVKDWLKPEDVEEGYVEYDPLGVIAIISPWNAPFAVPFNSIPPALLIGNSVIHKPSENSMQTGIIIDDMFKELEKEGFPKNLLQTIVGAKDHGRELVKQDVALVSFTGSTAAGKDIMKNSADKLHKIIFELGGLDAAIVLKDVNVEETANEIVNINCRNTGQICCSIKRVYVEKEIYNDFVKAATQASKKITYGDPTTDVDMGPFVAKFQLDKIEEIMKDTKESGAKILTGGQRPDKKGYFYPSTIVTDVNHDMRIMKEEPFGPIVPIFSVDSYEEAIKLANDTKYGLTGSVWTKDIELAKKIAKKLEVGVAGINAHGGGPDGTPWGGAKESGIGRARNKDGFREFSNVKLVRILEN